ncbi:MAG TPA: hypothetical protein VF902_08325 [Coriobacteriia bacterium]
MTAASPATGSSTDASAAATQRLFEAKARAELARADRLLGGRLPVAGSGDPIGRVLLVKGEPGEADRATRTALAGPDGEAASKALERLGFDPRSAWATCSRPGRGDEAALSARLRLIIEAVDPAMVLGLDAVAAEDLARALGIAMLRSGVPVTVMGRVVGSLEGLEASLGDAAAKARVWRQMQAVAAGAAGSEERPRTSAQPGPG